VVRDSGNGGVQSVQRAFEILEVMASAGGGALALSEIATATGRPAPSIHRLIRTLVELGYVRQDSSRRYALAPGLIRLGDGAARQFGTWAEPLLTELVNTIGETANMAILEGTQALYVAQVAGRHSMRMFTQVGRRVPLHSTGVGKALLCQLPDQEVLSILNVAGMPPATDRTITNPDALVRELAAGRALGYVSEDGEQELGVSCVAVPVPGSPVLTAISFSGPAPRMTSDAVRRAATALQEAAGTLADRFTNRPTG
jgi:IclR family transcriptional regulator, acetate operon repressor